ncbi:MAG: HEPN domain protein [Euryarchaeota archaeon ADurb.Bin190]|nr:MAG: HEPN domain protein [Euryarchaeota archaeon ADurb.Bin190]HNQ55072.1 HEPN domain-containing protein [Methanothrix sp.]HNU40324.1 HEPN domain-containing protein [Methanothrix sp.]HPM26678.1 HEPN domain-containing protein [Methanothrix sp.]HQQ37742.1 HEPN domain-containing protein [Methanothrix sp.]
MKNIDNCFELGLLRRTEPSRRKSDQSLLSAREWLSEAEKNLEAEALRSALSSAYLAVFHSARAVLFRDGVREKSHYCIGLYLQRYVEEGSLEENWPMLFDRIRSMRHADQYSFMARPTGEEVQAGIDLAERFIERMERLLQETG